MVERGVETEQRQSEPAAAERCPVTAAGVAPGLRQDRLDLARETDGDVRGRLLDRDRNRSLAPRASTVTVVCPSAAGRTVPAASAVAVFVFALR
jgi:hypothetical protein